MASTTGPDWVPPSCTLPTEEQPLRLAEWDALFASQTAAPHRPGPLRVRLELPAGAECEERTRDLAERENGCCSFFDFTVTGSPEGVVLDIAVGREHEPVLRALTARADRAVRADRVAGADGAVRADRVAGADGVAGADRVAGAGEGG